MKAIGGGRSRNGASREPAAAAAAILAALSLGATAAPAAPAAADAGSVLVDGFEQPLQWSAHPADGVAMKLSSEPGSRGQCLRLDFRFAGGGWAIARRDAPVTLPRNWAFRFRVRGECAPNHLEFKLVDASGENVWWSVQRDFAFPREWDTVTIRKRHVTFAWGPRGGGEPSGIAAIELAVTAGQGGEGTIWVDELELVELPEVAPVTEGESFAWRTGESTGERLFAADLGTAREWGALVLDWVEGRHAADYVVEGSADGEAWDELSRVTGANGGRDWLFLPESESRHVRVRVVSPAGAGGAELAAFAVKPLAWSSSREAFFEQVAGGARRGLYPRGIRGEQPYWTVVGLDRDTHEALLGEDGALESGPSGFSVEPFLERGETLVTWADVAVEQSLLDGALPVPSVTWRGGGVDLVITAVATGEPGASQAAVRYTLRNTGREAANVTLHLAVRPFQVNPPSQALNLQGGAARIEQLSRDGRVVSVNGERKLVSLTTPTRWGASTFAAGDVVAEHLERGALPGEASVEDPFGAASGAFSFARELPAGGRADVVVRLPLSGAAAEPPLPPEGAACWFEEQLAASRAAWSSRVDRVRIELPSAAGRIAESIRAQLGWILVNRAGAAIQPGTRSYARSWIRDGSLTCSALLRLGHADPARDFLEWYAPHQYADGKIPCVVDRRGADPVPEHDSSGEFIFLVAEIWRHGRDRPLLDAMWPRVLSAADYLDRLRRERRTDEYRAPEKAEFFGILPPSISHEGYSAKPMHSYWDDFFALRGFDDAVFLAGEVGNEAERDRLAAIRDEFAADLAASVRAAMAKHGIDYVPGCADLGDFDATSTTIALSPTGAARVLPEEALRRTFERYWEYFGERRAGEPWEAYTPYELRHVGAFVRLGWRDRAAELLEFFLDDQRPAPWRQWPEVVWRDLRSPRFLGDLPHGWVGSDFLRSVLDMLAYEREDDQALVLGAGVPSSWLDPPGVRVTGLRTRWGALDFTMSLDESEAVVVQISGEITVPPGGLVLSLPLDPAVRRATVNGRPAERTASGDVVVRGLPAVVVFAH
ncbi:MAG: discoidin domain-containing protein [Candidatus Eiseniibacteriota bacterium]